MASALDLKHIAGPVEPLKGRTVLEPGTVLVVLQNGKPHSVLDAGRRRWRGLGLPTVGVLTGIVFRLDTHVLELDVRQVLTKAELAPGQGLNDHPQGPSYPLAKISIQFGLELNMDDEGAALMEFVAKGGNRVQDRLYAEARNALESLVRDTVKNLSHTQLYLQNISGFLDLNQPLLGGLFRGTQVLFADVTWNAEFTKIAESEAKLAVELNEIQLTSRVTTAEQLASLAAIPGEKLVASAQLGMQLELEKAETMARLEMAKTQAEALGLPTYVITHPELYAAQQDTVKSILEALVANPRSANSPHVQGLIQNVVQALAPMSGPIGDRAATPTTPSQEPPPPAAPAPAIEQVSFGSSEEVSAALGELGLRDAVMGSGLANRESGAAAIIVARNMGLVDSQRAEIERQLRTILGKPTKIFIVNGKDTVADLVEDYFEMRSSELPAEVAAFQAEVENDLLRLTFRSPAAQTAAVRQAINDPATLILEPVQRALRIDNVFVIPEDDDGAVA